VRAPDDIAILQDGGRISERAPRAVGVRVHAADAQGDGADAFGGFRQNSELGFHKIGAQQQIPRRVATQEQFRGEDKFRAARTGGFVTGDEFLAVCGKITDGRIELEQADFQRSKNKWHG